MTTAKQIAELFTQTFAEHAEGVWSAPGRVNLIGEHTDYTGGFVMPFAIEQRAYVAARRRNDGLVRAIAYGREQTQVNLKEFDRNTPGDWLGYLAGAAWIAGDDRGWDLALGSDIPIGGGLSSSAAITCATLLAMNEIGEWDFDLQTLAAMAQRVEHDVIGTPCGIMDQTASLRCIDGHLLMVDTRSLEVAQIPWLGPVHQLSFIVTDTRTPHQLADGQYALRRLLCEEATVNLGLDQLRDATPDLVEHSLSRLTPAQAACARHVTTENQRVLRVRELLEAGEPESIGPELTASHASLRDEFKVTVPQLDLAVDASLEAGALGSRMTGGGFGGCTITLVKTEQAAQIQLAIKAAFAHAGFDEPTFFLSNPSPGGTRNL